MSKILMTGL